MKNRTRLLVMGVLALAPVWGQTPSGPAPSDKPASSPQKPLGNPATVHDFLVFLRATRPLRSGQLATRVTMDIVGEGMKLKVRADISQTYSTIGGRFVAETAVWPPAATAPNRYKVYYDGKSHTIHDLGAKSYATASGLPADDFFVRGTLANFVREALAKVPDNIMKMIDAKELTPELTAALKEKMGEGDGAMYVREDIIEGKTYQAYEIQASAKKPEERVTIFINTTTDLPELLQFKGRENNLDIAVLEKVIKFSPKIPSDTSYRFVRRRGMKRVTKIEIGGF